MLLCRYSQSMEPIFFLWLMFCFHIILFQIDSLNSSALHQQNKWYPYPIRFTCTFSSLDYYCCPADLWEGGGLWAMLIVYCTVCIDVTVKSDPSHHVARSCCLIVTLYTKWTRVIRLATENRREPESAGEKSWKGTGEWGTRAKSCRSNDWTAISRKQQKITTQLDWFFQ